MGRQRAPPPSKWPTPRPKPLPPPVNLGRTPGDMWMVEGVLSAEEAASFIHAAEAVGFSTPPPGPPAPGMAARDNARLAWTDASLADALWRILAPSVAAAGAPDTPFACSPALRLYRYTPGQRFARHFDDAVEGVLGPGTATRHTVLVYLSACSGGETVFYGGKGKQVAAVAPAPGRALIHRHGDDCLLHEGAKVREGTKYVLRTDLVYRE